MKVATAALVALLLVGCAQGPGPVPNPTSAVRATPGVISSPAPFADTCRLPVREGMGGGFLGYPSAVFVPDPKGGFQAGVAVPPRTVSPVLTIARPVLTGDGRSYYDRAPDRWLPVSRNAVAPDGLHYVYIDGGFNEPVRLHLVDVLTGTESVHPLPFQQGAVPLNVVDFANGAVYLTNSGYEAPASGLYRLDLATDKLQTISEDGQIQVPVAGSPGVIWFDDAGTRPETAAIGYQVPRRVVRLDLASGARQPWFEPVTGTPWVLGVDLAGLPFVRTDDSVWLLRAPNDAIRVGEKSLDVPISDSHGTWFGDPGGVFLYAGGKLTRVWDHPAVPANGCV